MQKMLDHFGFIKAWGISITKIRLKSWIFGSTVDAAIRDQHKWCGANRYEHYEVTRCDKVLKIFGFKKMCQAIEQFQDYLPNLIKLFARKCLIIFMDGSLNPLTSNILLLIWIQPWWLAMESRVQPKDINLLKWIEVMSLFSIAWWLYSMR